MNVNKLGVSQVSNKTIEFTLVGFIWGPTQSHLSPSRYVELREGSNDFMKARYPVKSPTVQLANANSPTCKIE